MDIKTIELKKTILEDNDKDADQLREQLKEDGVFYVNIMSSPGSGKTTRLSEPSIASMKRLRSQE